MKFKAKLTISKAHNSQGDYINLRIKDSEAGIGFVDLKIDMAEFAQCVTGLAYVECSVEVRDLEHVGKKMEMDTLEFEIPDQSGPHRKETAQKYSLVACAKLYPGWTPDTYFGSQNSFFQKEGRSMARCSIRRWVDK